MYSTDMHDGGYCIAGDWIKRTSQPGKRMVGADLHVALKKQRQDTAIDYTKCIICQGQVVITLRNVQPLTKEKLILAMIARQDDVSRRLQHDSITDMWLADKVPKWHDRCRNWYINEKSYKLAEKALLGDTAEEADSAQPECSTSSQQSKVFTRTNTPTFNVKKTCVICNKQWLRGKEPTCKVSTKSSQQAIIEKAKTVNREDILLRLIDQGHDMVPNDISYHKPCMNIFKAQRVPTERSSQENVYNVAFAHLVEQLEVSLFHDMRGFLMKNLRDQYREILRELGVKTADSYRSINLKWRLQQRFNQQISFINQSSGSGFICASNVPLGDALEKLRQLEAEQHVDEKHQALYQAAKILRADFKQCRMQRQDEQLTEISFTSADKIVPDSVFNFLAMLLCGNARELQESGRVKVDLATTEKVLIASQQLLQHVTGIVTPLGIASAFHVYNQTRSKSLITVNNRLGQGISYDRLQRQLTAQSANIMQQVEEDGVYIPEDMAYNNETPHVFAMDNLDWKKKTLEGGSFNATTAIIIENPTNTYQPTKQTRKCYSLYS